MAFTEGNGNEMVMPVAPMTNGNGMFGGDSWGWIILLLLFASGGGGFGFGNGENIYPWMNQSNQISNGFRDQMIDNSINQIQNGLGALSNQLCNSFADVQAAANARQMADMQQGFAMQTILNNSIYENRGSIADLKATVLAENCADRTALAEGIREVLSATQAQTQTILNQLNQDKLDAKNAEILALERQLAMANLQASQVAQTAEIISKLPASTTA